MEPDLLKKCKLPSTLEGVEPEKKIHTGMIGLPNGPNLGFINTVFLQLFNHRDTRKILKLVDDSKE